MTYRLRNILIALALAIVAALLTTYYVANYKKHVQRQQATVTVVVATKDIPVGLSGEEILKGHYLTTQSIVRGSVVPGALADPNFISKQVATQPIYSGEQVTARRFGSVVATGIHGQLTGVYRALQVPGDPNTLLAGTLQEGDHVDIVASIKYKVSDVDVRAASGFGTGAGGSTGANPATAGDQDRTASRIVLRDIKVLRTSGSGPGKIPIGTTGGGNWVIVAVTDNQAQKLFWVMRNAQWSLALRPVIHAADSPNSVETIESVLGDGLKLNEYVQLYAGKGPTR